MAEEKDNNSAEDAALEEFWRGYQKEKKLPVPEDVNEILFDSEKKEINLLIFDKIKRKQEETAESAAPDHEKDPFADIDFEFDSKDKSASESLAEKVPEISEVIKKIGELPAGTDLISVIREYEEIKKQHRSFDEVLSVVEKKFGPDIKKLIKSLEITGVYIKRDIGKYIVERAELEEEVSEFSKIVNDEDFHRESDYVRNFDDILRGSLSESDKNSYLNDELKFAGFVKDSDGKDAEVESKFNFSQLSKSQRLIFKKKIELMKDKKVAELISEKDVELLNRLYKDAHGVHQSQVVDLEAKLLTAKKENDDKKIKNLEDKLKEIKESVFDIVIKSLDVKKLSSGFLKLYVSRLKYFVEIRDKFAEKNEMIFERYY